MIFDKDLSNKIMQQLNSALNEIEENRKQELKNNKQTYSRSSNTKPYPQRSGSITYKPTHIEGSAEGTAGKTAANTQKKEAGTLINKAGQGTANKISNDSENKIYAEEIEASGYSAYLDELSFKREDLIKGIIYSEILTPKFKDN